MKNQELSALNKKDLTNLGILLIITIIIFQILFIKSGLFSVIRVVFAIFWLFVIPGFFLMGYWKLDFLSRVVFGTVLGYAVIGVFGYNMGLIGIKLGIQSIILPLGCIVLGFFLDQKTNNKQQDKNNYQ